VRSPAQNVNEPLNAVKSNGGKMKAWFVLPLVCVTVLVTSCANIPSEFTKQVDQNLTFSDAKRAPEQFRGKILLLGGTVIERTDLPGMTQLRIYEHEVDSRYSPYIGGPSEGEFLIVIRSPVNPAQYPPGERITVVGKLTGVEPAAGRQPLPSFDALYMRAWGLPSFSDDKVYDRPSCQRVYGAGC
jgi:outer membrane lipoprotein